MRFPLVAGLFLLGIVPVSSCDYSLSPQTGGNVSRPASFSPPSGKTYDDYLAGIAEDVPGFAGWWVDKDTVVIALVDINRAEEAKLRMMSWISDSPSLRGKYKNTTSFKIVLARYDFAQLKKWYDEHVARLPSEFLSSTDIAESKNMIAIGVINESAVFQVREALLRSGIPAEALHVEIRARKKQAAVLTDSIRPIMAGVQFGRAGLNGCTLGYTFRYSGSATTYYATNSHCTVTQGIVDTTRWFQPHYGTGAGVATEAIEGDWWYCATLCTYADIALLGPATSGHYAFGRIARTEFASTSPSTSGSLTLDPNYPNGWQIVGVEAWPVEGQEVERRDVLRAGRMVRFMKRA